MGSVLFIILKYTFYVCNLIILMMGGLLLLLGIYARALTPTIPDPIISLLNPGNLIIAFSVLNILFALIGTLGSVRENSMLLGIYSGTIVLLIILEIGLILFVYLGKGTFEDLINGAILKLIENYRTFSDLRVAVDLVQNSLSCCGSRNKDDWDRNRYFNCNFTGISACGVPTSCCLMELQINSQCGYLARNLNFPSRAANIHSRGCIEGFGSLLTDNFNVLVGSLSGVFLLEIAVICFSLWLIAEVKKKRNRVSFSNEEVLINHNTDHTETDWDIVAVDL